MDTFSIRLEGLRFPNFKNDQSKKNFRLMLDVNHFNDDGKPQTTHITFPLEDVWQWNDQNKRFYIPQKNVTDKTVDLDFDVFLNGVAEFSETDTEILVTQGKLHSVIVHIVDVHDKNFVDLFETLLENSLPVIFDAASGGIVGIVGNKLVGKIIGSFKGDDITSEILKRTKGKDKILCKAGKFQSKYGKLTLNSKGVFKNKDDMSGDYRINLNYSKISI
ncbi:MAG: hypothetical protein R2681_03300 [Pyrinomonadaceae bacterium]